MDDCRIFRNLHLKPELQRAIEEGGLVRPPELQHECIPLLTVPEQFVGTGRCDLLCHATHGMGKAACFVIACLQRIDVSENAIQTIVICRTSLRAYEIKREFDRFGKYMPFQCDMLIDGTECKEFARFFLDSRPHILIATIGRLWSFSECMQFSLHKCTLAVIEDAEFIYRRFKEATQNLIGNLPDSQLMMIAAEVSQLTPLLCQRRGGLLVTRQYKYKAEDSDSD